VPNNKLSLYFPTGYKPTNKQAAVIDKIGNALDKHKFVICCAPTGSGKSMIARTIAELTDKPTDSFRSLITSYEAYKQDFTGRYVNSEECHDEPPFGAFALTITKSLQDQYSDLFNDSSLLKGKMNYVCDVDDNFMVDLAPCTFVPRMKEKCWSDNRCPYYSARNEALLSRFSVLNYKMFLALPGHVKRKNIIICDEASELEEELIRQFSAEINYDKLQSYKIDVKKLISDNKERARIWICQLIEKITDQIDKTTQMLSEQPELITKAERIKFQYLKNLHNSLSTLESMWSACEYVVDVSSDKVTFTPLHANELSKHIFDYADKIVLMSATIIDHKHFAKSLGITDYKYIEMDSDFDASKSPIYVSSAYKLNYKLLKTNLPKICKQVQDIISHHKNDKGIIHTHTQEITNFLRDRLPYSDRLLFRDEHSNNETILRMHKETQKPTILVSPSLAYGVDLKDELARFQIIIKLPFFPLGSKRVKKLFDIDPDWYENKMLNAIVQASGRATRSSNDYSITYILDATFVNIIKKSKNKLPKHFIDRIH
jgi:ATP-dependent DNA helicase DinG